MIDLTKRQESILEWIIAFVAENGLSPTISEMQRAFGIGWTRGVTVHLDALAKKGYISRSKLVRSIQVLKDANGNDVRNPGYAAEVTDWHILPEGCFLTIKTDAAFHPEMGQALVFQVRRP